MQITYSNDEQRGAGHGILKCTDHTFTKGGYSVALERASDHCFLAGNGEWGSQQIWLPVDKGTTAGTELQLLLGPSIVDQLDTQERYRVHVTSEDGFSAKALLQVKDIDYSSPETLSNTVIVPPPQAAANLSKETPQKTTSVAQDPKTTATPENAENSNPSSASELAPDYTLTASRPHSRSKLPVMSGIVLILALLGTGAWYFLYSQPEPPQRQEATPVPEALNPDSQIRPPSPDVQQQPVSQAETTPPLTAEERVKLFFGGKEITPSAAATLCRELPTGTPTEQDAVYRLYYFAGENGETSVLMDYASCLDPTKPQWGSINKDAVAAWEIYEKARVNNPEAANAQQALRSWLEQKAETGDVRARFWLDRLP
ncbi:MAG: hypothetical protein J5861_07475 [Desulfovibrio sp.]|nr:hypothetical protein [Desulfovibrio sp.]